MTFDQAQFEIRCEWGPQGLAALAPASDVVIVIDVLSFTTAVEIATARGGTVFPFPLKDETAQAYADAVGANLASHDRAGGFSLSPASLLSLPAGYKLVLPSPNGAALAYSARHPVVPAACLRNATAVAKAATSFGSTVAVIPAGERWPGGELRPCLEDLIGAGAVIAALPGTRSPDAALAVAAFERFRDHLPQALRQCGSGRELIERGCELDVDLAAALDCSATVPRLVDGALRALDR
jgi:2-phosphosulfolactate phosphatase